MFVGVTLLTQINLKSFWQKTNKIILLCFTFGLGAGLVVSYPEIQLSELDSCWLPKFSERKDKNKRKRGRDGFFQRDPNENGWFLDLAERSIWSHKVLDKTLIMQYWSFDQEIGVSSLCYIALHFRKFNWRDFEQFFLKRKIVIEKVFATWNSGWFNKWFFNQGLINIVHNSQIDFLRAGDDKTWTIGTTVN